MWINPHLIYVSILGFGQDGPYRLKAGHDLTYLGIADMLYMFYCKEKQEFSSDL
jgi:crotonobetainyl-CoA:carnitine CoA-transferase CaiB-like acyl-CoA transferase